MILLCRIELQVNAPTAGQHTSLTPVITIPSGVSYRLEEMPIWIQGDLDRHTPVMEEFFMYADNYGVRMQVFANEGYRFAENLSVIVNGVTLSAESLSSAQKGTDILFFFSDENSGNTGSEAPGSSSQPEGSDSDDQSQSTASGSGDQSQDSASGSESTALDSVQSQIPVLPENNVAAVQTLPEKDSSSSSGVLKKESAEESSQYDGEKAELSDASNESNAEREPESESAESEISESEMRESDLKEQTQIQDKDSAQDDDASTKEKSSGLWWIWLLIIAAAVLIFAVGVWYKKRDCKKQR